MATAAPGDHVVDAKVVFGAEVVALRGAATEVAGDVNAGSFDDIGVAILGVFADDGELIEQYWRERRVQVHDRVVFVPQAVVGGAGECLAADTLVLSSPLFVAVLRVG